MRRTCVVAISVMVGMLLVSGLASAQGDAPLSPWKYYPEEARANDGPGGPAPMRDITGTWLGESSGGGVPLLVRPESPPPLTPLGRQLFDRNIPEGENVSVADTNDPHYRFCDPFGFPRNMNDQIRSITITTLPDRTFVLLKFMNIWREIWIDGRALPANVGGRGPDAHDPTYNGYSVGYWEDNYTFVLETTGMAPETWVTETGYPHSVNAVVTMMDILPTFLQIAGTEHPGAGPYWDNREIRDIIGRSAWPQFTGEVSDVHFETDVVGWNHGGGGALNPAGPRSVPWTATARPVCPQTYAHVQSRSNANSSTQTKTHDDDQA